jgi:hypothetical protein
MIERSCWLTHEPLDGNEAAWSRNIERCTNGRHDGPPTISLSFRDGVLHFGPLERDSEEEGERDGARIEQGRRGSGMGR